MSFIKTVNGVTFTSDNFTNIDVSFDKKGYFTYIYISTTDNQTFNNDTTSDYHIVHDGVNLGVTQILLQNDNKTAKLYVHTREFNEYNSYNIQQLPLTEISTQPTQPTQKLEDHSENGYKVYIPSDCTSINGGRTSPNYTGYEVVPPTGLTLNSDIVKTIYADVNGDNSTRVQGTLNGNNIKFIFSDTEWSVLNYSRVRDTKGNLIYNLQDYVKQLDKDGNITYVPRSQEDLDKIADLVRGGLGLNESRGDFVKVETVSFPHGDIKPPLPWYEQEFFYRLVRIGGSIIIVLIVIIFIIRPLLNKLLHKDEDELNPDVDQDELDSQSALDGYDDFNLIAKNKELADQVYTINHEGGIELPNLHKEADLLKAVRTLASNEPQLTAEVIKDWLEEDLKEKA